MEPKREKELQGYSFGNVLAREKNLKFGNSAILSGEDGDKQAAWESFEQTGKIGDYLKYRESENVK